MLQQDVQQQFNDLLNVSMVINWCVCQEWSQCHLWETLRWPAMSVGCGCPAKRSSCLLKREVPK